MTSPKILIVDDEPFNVDYLEQELAESGCETIAAFGGREALHKVESEAPDLVLLDIMMPGMDGFEVMSCLKSNPDTRDIPVIVISANDNLQNVVKGIQLGAEDYLPKPFEPVLLQARITSSLEKKRLRDLKQLYLKSLERELEIAREIQQGFLPSELPKVDGWEIAAYFKAAHEVAGDFYDAFLLPDDQLVCVVGDVCGKGVGAALFMTLFRSLIRATAKTNVFFSKEEPKALKPPERLRHIVSFTNNYIAETHGESNMFATVFIGSFNLQDGRLTYINCGNEPPLLVGKGGEVTALRPTGPVIGLFPNANFSVRETKLEKSDLFLAFTDGIPDSKNERGEFFDNTRLATMLGDRNTAPAELLSDITAQLLEFTGTAEQFDDITLLAVKRNYS